MTQTPMNGTPSGAVYVATNTAPNEVIVFRRAGDGSLDRSGSVATGGDGCHVVRPRPIGSRKQQVL